MECFVNLRLTAVMVIGALLCCNVHSINATQSGIDGGLCDEASSESDCVWYILEDIRIKLHQGFPFEDVPPLDPFKIPLIPIKTSDGSNMNVVGDFQNVSFTGLTGYVSEAINFDPSASTKTIRIVFPTMQLDGVYNLTGTVLHIVPVVGNGDFVFRLDDVTIVMNLHVIKVNNKPAINNLTTTITIEDVFIDLQNLDGPFQYPINIVLNIVAELLQLAITPKLGHILQDYFKAMINEYLSIVSI